MIVPYFSGVEFSKLKFWLGDCRECEIQHELEHIGMHFSGAELELIRLADLIQSLEERI